MESVDVVPNSTYTGGIRIITRSMSFSQGMDYHPRYLTVVTRVCTADLGRICPRLTRGFKAICTGAVRGRRISSHGLKVKSDRKKRKMI